MAFIHNSKAFFPKIAIATVIFSAGFALVAPANASVLVEPAIRRGGNSPAAQPAAPVNQSSQSSENIVEFADTTAGFSQLSSALKAANLGSILSGDGPFTLFAPTDAAFSALPAGTLESLLQPENRDLLVKLLYNHVGYGEFTSDRLNAGSFETFNGSVNVAVIPTGVTIDNANVIQADVDASNGVVHAVDKVLVPAGFVSQLEARANGTAAPAATAASPAPSSTARITRANTLQEGAIDRPSAPVAPVAPVAPIAPSAPVAPVVPAAPTTARPSAPAAPAAPAEPERPVRGLW
jgi:uncharacterized surface protein with fasciclin (FAS1) repeats